MRHRWTAVIVAGVVAAPVTAVAATTAQANSKAQRPEWRLRAEEDFSRALDVDDTPWTRDPQGPRSPWAVDQFDDDGEAWHAISDPDFTEQLDTLDVYRKRAPFGDNSWLTAEIAAVDKDRDGEPDSDPGLSTVQLPDGEKAGKIAEPSWDAGVLIRPSRPLPARYRAEVTLRAIDFGGQRDGSFEYDGKYNGYDTSQGCKTGFPWTFEGALPDTQRCDYPEVTEENGFYYLTVLDHANPAPHGNPGIHYRRKVIMDGYYSNRAGANDTNGICDPKTGEIHSTRDGTYNGVNAIFARGDDFRPGNTISNEYYFKTACGEYSGDEEFGDDGQYSGILTSAELRPELLPGASYRFAVERDRTGYAVEMSGPFRHVGQATLRYHHDFVEDGRPIWHYNQTPEQYDGAFDRSMEISGHSGSHTTEHTWPEGSAYPDSFVIGDPHLNFYEGSAVVDDIRLYTPA